MLITAVSLIVVQEMCARMGAVTGKGLSDLIREEFGIGWAALAMLSLLIANGAITISEFVGINAATRVIAQEQALKGQPLGGGAAVRGRHPGRAGTVVAGDAKARAGRSSGCCW